MSTPFSGKTAENTSFVLVDDAAQVHALAVLPQTLQAVEGPGLLIEHMDGDAAVVQQDPRAAAITLPVQGLLTGLLRQYLSTLSTSALIWVLLAPVARTK